MFMILQNERELKYTVRRMINRRAECVVCMVNIYVWIHIYIEDATSSQMHASRKLPIAMIMLV